MTFFYIYSMKYIKPYSLFESNIYDADWKTLLPKEMVVLKDGEHAFKLGNIMKHSDMVQVTYENSNDEWGVPSTLEFDFYFSQNGHMRIDIDITWGDAMACEFYIESPDKIGVIEYTSFRSKTDPSNTIFALDDKSLQSFVDFLNRFDGVKLDVSQFNFLDKNDNYQPS
jgi:hypothetical protein